MRVKTHTRYTGIMVLNFQAIETAIRAFLECQEGRRITFPLYKPDIKTAPLTRMTDYEYFGPLVAEFNSSLRTEDEKKRFTLDTSIVDVRNALAHGRLFTEETHFPARLWKFGRPDGDGNATVEFCQLLTPEWLLKTHNNIARQYAKVLSCFSARKYKGLR